MVNIWSFRRMTEWQSLETSLPKHFCAKSGSPRTDRRVRRVFLSMRFVSRIAGDWTTIDQGVLTNDYYTRIGTRLGFNDCVILNPGTTSVGDQLLATTMKALFAAVYLDAGKEALERVLENLGITHEFLQVVTSISPPLFCERRVYTRLYANWVLRLRRWGTQSGLLGSFQAPLRLSSICMLCTSAVHESRPRHF